MKAGDRQKRKAGDRQKKKGGGRQKRKAGVAKKERQKKTKPKPATMCKGLTRYFCNRVINCCWMFPPRLPHREQNPGECIYTADGKCDKWDKQKPFNGKKVLSGKVVDGKAFDKANSEDGSADKLADKIQATRAKIGSNALNAIQPGNTPKDIQKI